MRRFIIGVDSHHYGDREVLLCPHKRSPKKAAGVIRSESEGPRTGSTDTQG